LGSILSKLAKVKVVRAPKNKSLGEFIAKAFRGLLPAIIFERISLY